MKIQHANRSKLQGASHAGLDFEPCAFTIEHAFQNHFTLCAQVPKPGVAWQRDAVVSIVIVQIQRPFFAHRIAADSRCVVVEKNMIKLACHMIASKTEIVTQKMLT
ncbi:hypothetical protein EGI20_17390 [Aquitalea sp. S1-19]|nr:hypothetical protein [Aquitalea sp. S1-19]